MLDIWDEMRAMERRMDDMARTFLGPRSWITFPLGRPFIPATDVFTRDRDLVVRAELPGIDPDKDAHVTLVDGELVVRGERKRTEEVKEQDYYRAETAYGAFERRVPVPAGTTGKDIRATYDKGVLEVVVQGVSTEEIPPEGKRIPIQTEKPKTGRTSKTV